MLAETPKQSVEIALADLATVQTGFTFRTSLQEVGPGATAVIQMRDITAGNQVDCTALARVGIPSIKETQRVAKGDLVFRSRGQSVAAAVVEIDPGEAILAAPLLRVRVREGAAVDARYLAWYINQPTAQAFFNTHAKGTFQKLVTKEALEMLRVAVPPLDVQRRIVALAALAEREHDLMTEIAEKRRQLVTTQLRRIVEG